LSFPLHIPEWKLKLAQPNWNQNQPHFGKKKNLNQNWPPLEKNWHRNQVPISRTEFFCMKHKIYMVFWVSESVWVNKFT